MQMMAPLEILGTDEDEQKTPADARWSEEKVDNFQEIFRSITYPIQNMFDTVFAASATKSQQELEHELEMEKLRLDTGADGGFFKFNAENPNSWILPAVIVGGVLLLSRKK